MILMISVKSLASNKQTSFLQNENRTMNKKIMGVLRAGKRGNFLGKMIMVFFPTNGTEITFSVKCWA